MVLLDGCEPALGLLEGAAEIKNDEGGQRLHGQLLSIMYRSCDETIEARETIATILAKPIAVVA